MPVLHELSQSRVPVKIWTDAASIEASALAQLSRTANLPYVYKHVAAMPDVHLGIGATVGTVLATQRAIIPAAVGVDIGCGMCAVKLPFKADQLEDAKLLKKLRAAIERAVPLGREGNRQVSNRTGAAYQALGAEPTCMDSEALRNAAKQLGSLGGGNHFIEVCRDLENGAWVMLHSGSRNIGKRIAENHIGRAKSLIARLGTESDDPDLAHFVEGTREFDSYIRDLRWAQNYAKANRNEMMLRVLREVSLLVYGDERGPEFMTAERVDCHHNYAEVETHFGRDVWVTRKGAVSARKGQLGIIPGSMGAKSYIVRGLGNPDSFHSCSHGAGRKMSRTEAKRRYTTEDLGRETKGVHCRKDAGVLDEIPSAYKDIEQVMANQQDLVEPVAELRQLICVKG